MAKSFETSAGVVYKPGAYGTYTVANGASGLSTTGVLILVGEADAGQDYSLETDLALNAFSPDQFGMVQSKYRSGPLVDAFKIAVSPANDPDISGSFQKAIIVKTNVSARASATLLAIGGGNYATLAAQVLGKAGNQIAYQTTSQQAETVPNTGAFTYIPPVGTVNLALRSNGGAELTAAVTAAMTPTAFQGLINALANVGASGGANRAMVSVFAGKTITIAATGNSILVTCNGPWEVIPTVGDTFIIASTAPANIADPAGGATNENVGAYVVTAAAAATVTATKLSDNDRATAVPGVITPPANVAVAVALAANTDILAYSPVTISQDAAAVIAGVGKTLEIADAATGTDQAIRTAFLLGTTTRAPWVSIAATPVTLNSAAEYQVKLTASRAIDGTTDTLIAGGDVAILLGYKGTTATVTVTDSTLTTTVVAGAGGNLSIALKDYATIQTLCDFIATQAGYSCTPATAAMGNLSPTVLDDVTVATCCSSSGAKTLRLKKDAQSFVTAVNTGSSLVQLGVPAGSNIGTGLPDVMAAQAFLSGGTRGGTSDAAVTAALLACEQVKANFVVTEFSRDAALDIADGLTEGGSITPAVTASSYTAAGVAAALRSHVLAMSTLRRRKYRQGFSSIADTFANSKTFAQNLASLRMACCFQDFKVTVASGLVQTLPWSGATLAAAMQAGAGYKSIEAKGINCSGVVSRAGDFNFRNDGQVDDALQAGLLFAEQPDTGGFQWVSDQTTYGTDNNFIFNGIQAVYACDTVLMTVLTRMEKALKGKSPADMGAAAGRAVAESAFAELLRLKWLTPSDDGAQKGFKNLAVRLIGNVFQVSAEVKVSTTIDFIEVNFTVSQVIQNA